MPGTGSVNIAWRRIDTDASHDDVEDGRPPAAPAISFSLPSAVDDSLARSGYHTASVWIYPVPPRLRGQSWSAVREEVAEALVDQIAEYAPSIRDGVRELRLRTPLDIEEENGLTDGCIWQAGLTGDQLFWNRPLAELADYRTPVAGLYLCGAGQHPGGDVTCLPGRNAAHEFLRDLGLLAPA